MAKVALSLMQRSLAEADPDIATAIRNETRRQAEGLELIASENFVSTARRGSRGWRADGRRHGAHCRPRRRRRAPEPRPAR